MAHKGMEKILHSELAEQVQDYTGNLRKVFRLVVKKTKPKDGRLMAPQILRVMRSLGMNPTEGEINAMIYEHDSDGKGKLSENEFIYAMMESMKINDSKEEIMQLFRMFDKDGNGLIDTSELKTMFEFACGPNTGVTMSEITDLLQELDIDGDSLLKYEEFVQIFANPNNAEDNVPTDEPVYFDV